MQYGQVVIVHIALLLPSDCDIFLHFGGRDVRRARPVRCLASSGIRRSRRTQKPQTHLCEQEGQDGWSEQV